MGKIKSEEALLSNPLIKGELLHRAGDLKRIETIGITAMGVIFSWFMAAIFYGALPIWVGVGYAAIGIVMAWGAMQALLIRSLTKSVRKIKG